MEKCRIPNHVHMWIIFYKSAQAFHRIGFCLRLAYIECNLLFHILPSIGNRIIHMNRIPHNISEEADRIFMKSFCVMDDHILVFCLIVPV